MSNHYNAWHDSMWRLIMMVLLLTLSLSGLSVLSDLVEAGAVSPEVAEVGEVVAAFLTPFVYLLFYYAIMPLMENLGAFLPESDRQKWLTYIGPAVAAPTLLLTIYSYMRVQPQQWEFAEALALTSTAHIAVMAILSIELLMPLIPVLSKRLRPRIEGVVHG